MARLLQKDVLFGLLCMAVAAFGLLQGRRYAIGTSDDMGPGYFPFVIFSLLMICGAGLLVVRLVRPDEMLDRWAWRPLVAITAAILIFGLTVEKIGFVLAGILLVLLASAAEKKVNWSSALLLSVLVSAGAALVFVVLLKLSLPLWPVWLMS